MTERTATIKVDIIGGAAAKAMLSDIAQQRNELLKQSKIRLNIDAGGVSQAQRAMAQTRANALSATRDMSVLGNAVTSKAVAPMAQYSALLGAVLLVTQKLGPGLVTALQRSNVEFTRQRDLMRFWGTSGYLSIGIDHFKSNLAGFVSTSGSGFTKWLQNTSAALSQYRTGLVTGAAAMIGVASAAALSSAGAQRYIESVFGTRLMYKKLGEGSVMDSAKAWVQAAQETPWSAGREARMGTFQTLLSKNPYLEQEQGKEMTEGLEKFFFANSEMLKKAGIGSAEALASAVSAQTMSGENAVVFRDTFGLGFETWTPKTRLTAITQEAGKLDMGQVVEERPEQALNFKLSKSLQGLGDVTLGPMTVVLNTLLKIAEAAGKIPHLPQIVGWGIVLTGAAASGAVLLSVLAPLAPVLGAVIGLLSKASLVTKGLAVAQWALNIALRANHIGLAITAVAALVAGLYILEKRFGVVTKAWNALKAGMSSLGGAFKDAGGMGVLKIAVDTLVASNPMLKILLFQVDFLKKIWLGGETLNKIMGGAMTIWQQIGQFFSWIGDILTTIQNTFGGGVGGVADKVLGGAGAAVQSAVNAAGDFLNPQEPAAESNPQEPAAASAHPGTDNAGNPLPFEPDLWYSSKDSGQWHKGSDLIKEWGPRANDARDLYKNAASATNPTKKSSGGSGTVTKTDVAGNTYSAPAPAKADPSKSYVTYGKNGTFEVHNTETGAVSKGFKTEKEAKDSIPKMAVGGTIIGSGSIIGHAGEEVSPASAVVGAKTTLERMSEAAEGGRGGSITVGGTTININVDRMDSDIDLERALAKAGDEFDRLLMFRLRNPLDSGSLRGIGYLRG